MRQFKTKGIILREVYVGESDKILKIFTKSKGKISVSAKGVRKHKSPLIAGSQLFSYSDFLIYSGRNYNIIQQVEVIKSFHGIGKDIFKLTYASYFLELLDAVTQEEEANEKLLLLILKTLSILEKTNRNPRLISVIYELRIMSLIGYMPQVTECVNCGSQENINSFDVKMGGIVCDNCRNEDNHPYKLSQTALYTLKYIMHSDLSKLFNFELDEFILRELEEISKSYISYHIEKEFKTLDFIKTISIDL
jgi:DNA repair protein RecO (recombination protein O)